MLIIARSTEKSVWVRAIKQESLETRKPRVTVQNADVMWSGELRVWSSQNYEDMKRPKPSTCGAWGYFKLCQRDSVQIPPVTDDFNKSS